MLDSGLPTSIGSGISEENLRSLRAQRWALLATGVGCAGVLVAYGLGLIPGLAPPPGPFAATVAQGTAAFLLVAGVGSWLLWTRLADTRTREVWVSNQGLDVTFANGAKVSISFADPALEFSLSESVAPQAAGTATIAWGKAGLGRSARITRVGADLVRQAAAAQGLRASVSSTGNPSDPSITTRFTRRL